MEILDLISRHIRSAETPEDACAVAAEEVATILQDFIYEQSDAYVMEAAETARDEVADVLAELKARLAGDEG